MTDYLHDTVREIANFIETAKENIDVRNKDVNSNI